MVCFMYRAIERKKVRGMLVNTSMAAAVFRKSRILHEHQPLQYPWSMTDTGQGTLFEHFLGQLDV